MVSSFLRRFFIAREMQVSGRQMPVSVGIRFLGGPDQGFLLRDEVCDLGDNRTFSQKAEDAHHNGTLQAFLREWVDTYGLNRCMFVLSCTMSRRESDGRFYPPARQAAARFAAHRKRREDHLTRYVNDVHSGIVNLAMEGLVKLELAQKHEKLHEPRKESMER